MSDKFSNLSSQVNWVGPNAATAATSFAAGPSPSAPPPTLGGYTVSAAPPPTLGNHPVTAPPTAPSAAPITDPALLLQLQNLQQQLASQGQQLQQQQQQMVRMQIAGQAGLAEIASLKAELANSRLPDPVLDHNGWTDFCVGLAGNRNVQWRTDFMRLLYDNSVVSKEDANWFLFGVDQYNRGG